MRPVLFHVGPLPVKSFFILMITAFAVAAVMAARRARAAGFSPGQIAFLGSIAFFSMTLGSRLGDILLNVGHYRRHPQEIWSVTGGGFSLVGGLVASWLVLAVALRRLGKPFLATIDRMIPPLALAHAIVRIGCFLQGCCYGRLTSVPWGVVYPSETVRRHPTQLYESGALLLIFFLLLRLERRAGLRPLGAEGPGGTNLLWYGFLYSAYRFGFDFFRADSSAWAAGLKLSQWVMLPFFFLFGFLLVRHARRCTPSS